MALESTHATSILGPSASAKTPYTIVYSILLHLMTIDINKIVTIAHENYGINIMMPKDSP
jgi:hypothetical protein